MFHLAVNPCPAGLPMRLTHSLGLLTLVETWCAYRSILVTVGVPAALLLSLHSILAASVTVPEFHTLPFPAASALREGGGTPSAACDCNCFADAFNTAPAIIFACRSTACLSRWCYQSWGTWDSIGLHG